MAGSSAQDQGPTEGAQQQRSPQAVLAGRPGGDGSAGRGWSCGRGSAPLAGPHPPLRGGLGRKSGGPRSPGLFPPGGGEEVPPARATAARVPPLPVAALRARSARGPGPRASPDSFPCPARMADRTLVVVFGATGERNPKRRRRSPHRARPQGSGGPNRQSQDVPGSGGRLGARAQVPFELKIITLTYLNK